MKKYYIYTLNNSIDGSPIYVGVTDNLQTRLSCHKQSIKRNKQPIYQYYRQINETPIIEVLEILECENLRIAQVQEDFWIEHLRWYGFKLFNVARIFRSNRIKFELMKELVTVKESTVEISERDKRIISLFSNGHTTAEISDDLRINKRTIESHVFRLRGLFHCGSITHLACEFLRQGLIK